MLLIAVATIGTLSIGANMVASSASSPVSGTVNVYIAPGKAQASPVYITGVIGDSGKVVTVDQSGKANQNGNFASLTFKHGTFRADMTALNAAWNNFKAVWNMTTCSISASVTASVTLSNGTGRYKAISGSISVTGIEAVIQPTYKSGANKGKCNLSSQKNTRYMAYSGTGTISY